MTEHPRSTVFERTGSFGGLLAAHEEHKRSLGAMQDRLDGIGRVFARYGAHLAETNPLAGGE